MNEVELIQNLIDRLDKLPNRDGIELDALQRRAKMIIKTIFGEKSEYLKDLTEIRFIPPIFNEKPSEEYLNESWDGGKKRLRNLFNTMLEELKLKLKK